ncbi:MAG TPA: SDR family NAD(P)-dependent oxidoreductase [Reyranella sp.]|nr:SDR family NAD(P)-dependent oxidoreductase [Reyranella sp.]
MGILEGKTCIVTGAAGSLGRASVLRFVAEGARVMLVDRDRAGLDAMLKSLPEGRATAMLADVASARDTTAYVEATVARWGPIDVLFSNTGISGVIRPVTDYPEDVFDRVMAVNLKGSFLACKHGLPRLSDGGSIVLTSSVVGVTSAIGIAAYAASKHGLIGLMRTVAKEAAPRRIRVNVVAPGPTDTAEEVAESVLFLATDRSAFTTGTVLKADVGRHS